MKRLTSDIAHDDKPVFSPSGKWIAFESDRPKPVLDPDPAEPLAWFDSLLPYKDIYRISVSGDSLTRIAGGRWDEKMPAYGPNDSLLYFVSNRSGLDNIYLWRDTAGGAWIRPVTNLLTGCFTPSLSYDGKQLVFSLFEAGGWDVYLMKDPLQKVQANELPKTRFIRYSEDSTIGFFRPPTWANLSSYKPDTAKDTTKAKKDSQTKQTRMHISLPYGQHSLIHWLEGFFAQMQASGELEKLYARLAKGGVGAWTLWTKWTGNETIS